VGGTTRLLVVVLGLSAIACGGHSPTGPSDPVKAETLIVNGMTRTYYLHVPAGFQSGSGALVLALHGATQSGSFFRSFTNLDAKADQAGFAVAYPEGLVEPGIGAVDWAFYRNDYVDDVSFLRALIETLEGRLHFDRRRVFVTGFSAGGFMAYRLAIELPDSVAAVAVVGGRLFREEGGAAANVPPARGPVSVLMLHGELDTPYCGGFEVDPLGRAYNASQDETFDYWAGPNGNSCTTVVPSEPLCRDGRQTPVTMKSATNCGASTVVTFYKLVGGSHLWYSTPMNVAGQVPFNPAFNAATGVTTNDIIWNFFSSHSR